MYTRAEWKANRLNRTLIDRTLALRGMGLPKLMWTCAILVAAGLRNCMPSSGLSATPYALLFGRVPDIKSLRVFGCAASVHIPKAKRYKLSNVTVSRMFLGYAQCSKAWQVLISTGFGCWQVVG